MNCNHQWHDATSSAGPEWVCAKCKVNYSEIKKTLTAPKRQWVGLTDEDIQSIHDTYHKRMGPMEFARAIEAKLREMNNG